MKNLSRAAPALPAATIAAFLALFVTLYAAVATVAEWRLGQEEAQSAMQKLHAAQGARIDWIVLGASHALPLAYGGVPARLEAETGQTMAILAEVGAGPLYSDFVLRQALFDLQSKHVLYVADSFTFHSSFWNEQRIADRKLLRTTPWRATTLGTMLDVVVSNGVAPRALVDYAAAFSKLNPPDRFPQDDWRGAENFERVFRPSRHATKARIDYLYPEPADNAILDQYLDVLENMIVRAQASGLEITVVRPPVPAAFRQALPGEAAFDTALRARLFALDVPLHDLSAALDDPALYFDTDHLNRDGVALLYERYLKSILTDGG